ncbi:MAG: IS66 family insertion sequence element accessory protein TnpB [Candidatus Competibacteraceae bacterium]|nr:IS66 family insertion sequence element accessory protein TnpB [Candidatus Competibacteraceae bacterium]
MYAGVAVHVFLKAVDMRKGADSLALLVQLAGFDVSQPRAFVFFSRGRDRVKLLYWDENGFWLCSKRLERGCFVVPAQTALSWSELMLVLQGIDLSVRRLRRVPMQCVARIISTLP